MATENVTIAVQAKDMASKTLGSVKSALGGVTVAAKAMGAAVAGASAAVVAFVGTTAASARETQLWADKLGLTTRELQKFEFAGKAAGVEVDRIRDIFKDLPDRMIEFKRGTEGFVELFNDLGVKVTDSNGRLKDTQDVILQLADASQRMNRQEFTGLIDALLSDAGTDAIPLLQLGAKGIKSLLDEAERAGHVMDDATIARFAGLNAEFMAMAQNAKTTKDRISVFLADIIDFSGIMEAAKTVLGEIREAFDRMDTSMGHVFGKQGDMEEFFRSAVDLGLTATEAVIKFALGLTAVATGITKVKAVAPKIAEEVFEAAAADLGFADVSGIPSTLQIDTQTKALDKFGDTLANMLDTVGSFRQGLEEARAAAAFTAQLDQSLFEATVKVDRPGDKNKDRVKGKLPVVDVGEDSLDQFLAEVEAARQESNLRIVEQALSANALVLENERQTAELRLEIERQRTETQVRFAEEVNNHINNLALQGVNMLGAAIGRLAVTGKFAAKEFGFSMLESIGQMMTSMGTFIALTSEGLAAISAGGFLPGIGIGVALIAAGSALTAAVGALRGGSRGGGGAGGASFVPFQGGNLRSDSEVQRERTVRLVISGPEGGGGSDLEDALATITRVGLQAGVSRGDDLGRLVGGASL